MSRSLAGLVLMALAACSPKPQQPTADTAKPSGSDAAPAPSPAQTASAGTEPTRELTEEERKFWVELGNVYNSEKLCGAGGWTGDANIRVKDGKIVRFEIVSTVGAKTTKTPMPEVVGKKVPPIPASYQKLFEGPVRVIVCFGSVWPGQPADE